MNTFRNFDLLERYARGGMTPDERAAFEDRLIADKDLSAEWTDYLLIARTVRQSIRAKSAPRADIGQLVADARSLAKSEGLLLTDEDIWLYLRGKTDPEQTEMIEKRMTADPDFKRRVEMEKNIVVAIRNFGDKMKVVNKIRESLRSEGFFREVGLSIKMEMELGRG